MCRCGEDLYSTRGTFFMQPLSGAVARLYYTRTVRMGSTHAQG